MKISIILTTVFLTVSLAIGQVPGQSMNVYGTWCFPVSEFSGSAHFNSDGFARSGPGLGFQYGIEPFSSNLGFVFDISLSLYRFDHEEVAEILPFNLVEKTEGGNYYSAPILLGPRVKAIIMEQTFYATALLGFNMLWHESIEGSTPPLYSREIKFDSPSTTFCWGISVGIELMDRFNVGFKYLNLGTPAFEYNRTIFIGNEVNVQERSFKSSAIHIVAGVIL